MPMKYTFTTVDDYISTFPEDVQQKLQLIRKIIKEKITDAEETISYGIPTYKRNEKYVVYFAGYKNYLSLYPVSKTLLSEFEDQSAFRISGKATVQFPLNKPLPIEIIRKVINLLLIAHLQKNK